MSSRTKALILASFANNMVKLFFPLNQDVIRQKIKKKKKILYINFRNYKLF